MEGYEFEEIDLPGVEDTGRHAQPTMLLSGKVPAQSPELLRLFMHRRSKQLGATEFHRIRPDYTLRQRPSITTVKREATEEEIRQHFVDDDELLSSINLVVKVAGQSIPLSLLKELFVIVLTRDEERKLDSDPLEDYLDVVNELKRHRTAFATASHIELLELIEEKMDLIEQMKLCKQGPSRKQIDIMEEYRAQRKRKEQLERRLLNQNDGLLDCLTADSIFDQANTISLLKVQGGLNFFSEKIVDLESNLNYKQNRKSCQQGTTIKLQPLDESKAEQYLLKLKGGSQRVDFLREMLNWHRDIQRIVNNM